MAYSTFIFKDYKFDKEGNQLLFSYSLDNEINFTETIKLDNKVNIKNLNDEQIEALNKCLQSLHLMLGISYYKTFCPKQIIIENYEISEGQALFFNKIYTNGLGEFSYVNKINLINFIKFPYTNIEVRSSDIELVNKSLVPVGGGKDSIVTIEKMKEVNNNFSLFCLNSNKTREEVAKIAGKPMITFERELSPVLYELNKNGVHNGHVPFSAILAFILPMVGILYGFNEAVLSNESSAEEGNIKVGDVNINHQYSKSYEFEKDFNSYVKKYLLTNFSYHSFLRPYKEIEIAKMFSKYKNYFPYFSSCNIVQTIANKDKNMKWCNHCPKCLFTYLILAPNLPKVELSGIFKSNLLNTKDNELFLKDLIGLGQHKPFECVGQYDECLESINMLAKLDDYKDDYLVKNYQTLGV